MVRATFNSKAYKLEIKYIENINHCTLKSYLKGSIKHFGDILPSSM